jgi:hypothetical protein
MKLESGQFISQIKTLNYNDLKIFLIPIFIFSIYLGVFNPGIATVDSINQLHQIASGHFTNWHPFFHTFIEMLCLKIYPSTLLIGILQILVFSTMWTVICKYNRDDNAKDDTTFLLQVIFTFIICMIPINALYSITLWKDVLFSYCLMFLCFLAMVMINKKGNVNYKFIILISLIMAFIAQLRGNGMYVIIITVVIYSVYLFFKRNVRMGSLLLILTVTFILLISSLNIAYDVVDNEKDAMMTKVVHMLADYYMNVDMEDADKNLIKEVLDENHINDHYILTGSDPILRIANTEHLENNKETYIGLAFKYSLKDPIHCLEYLFGSSPMVWNIIRDHWIGRPYYLNGDHDRMHDDFNSYYNDHKYSPTTPYENLSYVNWQTPAFDTLNLLALGIEGCFLDTIFNNPAFYMYLSIILLILIQMVVKTKEIFLMYVPVLLNVGIIFFSTPLQDYRYLYANLLVCYLLIIVFIGLRKSFQEKLHN